MQNQNTRRGFTLIELIVAVLIIAILAAVALPQYKKSVLKSRFTTVMPMAKAVADAQEVYFLANGQYSLDKAYLDITPMNVENTEVALSTAAEDENYNYVAAKRTDYPNARYIIYQKHSPKFAGNIHCEAADAEAEWLCEKGLGGQFISGSVSGGSVKTYVLQGTSSDSFLPPCPANATCDSSTGAITSCASGYYVKNNACAAYDYTGDTVCSGFEINCTGGYGGHSSCSHSSCLRSTFTGYSTCDNSDCVNSTFSGHASCERGACYSSSYSEYASCSSGYCYGSKFRDNAVCSGEGCDRTYGTTYEGNACCTTGGDCPPCS